RGAGRRGGRLGVCFLRVGVYRSDPLFVLPRQQPLLWRKGLLAVFDIPPAAIRSGSRVCRQEDDSSVVQRLSLILDLARNAVALRPGVATARADDEGASAEQLRKGTKEIHGLPTVYQQVLVLDGESGRRPDDNG